MATLAHPYIRLLAQNYSALAYSYDHEAEVNSLIEMREREANQLPASLSPPPIRAKLLAAKKARQ